ncbi:hypothetical protein [Hymenobacter lucidus]|uniref:Uncharacterized protein n=1 Tax=Hymenobacter lucidus TaxID=2880930 RepID=A0ABS8AQ61_9BACT|nr:hypothetical protein [Hymenobacter lucidus]MCB2407476.1 hypothetical protein [Hymenobacter lucidus]
MATPLTLYVPIKQDQLSQAAAAYAQENFVQNVKAGLDASGIVHYARLSLIPNPSGSGTLGILLDTVFDGPMNPYLDYFWQNDGTKTAFQGIAAIALHAPEPPVTDQTGFENFIDKNNLNKKATDLYQAYALTVEMIVGSPEAGE